jgi:hypothetical protein
VGDVVKPWAHVAIVLATRYPSYFDLNVEPGERLIRERDECFDTHVHRRGYFDLVDAAEPLRVGFEAKAWKANRVIYMRHEAASPRGPDVAVEENPLRRRE